MSRLTSSIWDAAGSVQRADRFWRHGGMRKEQRGRPIAVALLVGAWSVFLAGCACARSVGGQHLVRQAAGSHYARETMDRHRRLVGIAAAATLAVGLTTAGAGGLAEAAAAPAGIVVAGSVAPFTGHTPVVGTVAASTRLSVQLWLRPRLAAAQAYAAAVSTPGSPLFHRYLSPAAYTARFGAPVGPAAAVESWLRAQGFTAVRTDAQRTYVRGTATVARIDAAFHVQLKLYRSSAAVNAGPYPLRANDRPITLPAGVARSVLGVTGLDNAAPVQPLERYTTGMAASTPKEPCSQYYGQHVVSGLPKMFGRTTFPTENCGYSGSQLRAAYGASAAATGAGQTIALVELGLTKDMFLTLQDYAARNGVPAPSPQRYAELSLGSNTCGDPFDMEEQLDVEVSHDMAPGASQLVVGGDACNTGDFGLQGLFDADIAVLNGADGHPLASVASNSWESGSEEQPLMWTNIEHGYLVRAVTEGVGMYFSSGDASGVESPSSDPDAIAVGGTTLGIGQVNNRLFETGWSDGWYTLSKGKWMLLGQFGAAGGGPSLLWKQPGYQKGVVPTALARAPGNRSGLVRSVPDVSADADLTTGMAVGLLSFPKKQPPHYAQIPIGGTSVATALVAGMVTAAQQGQAVPFGFTDPLFYKLAGTSAFFDALPVTSATPALYRGVTVPPNLVGVQSLMQFDDQSDAVAGYTGQVTLPGYDNMTGLGTPNGPAFIAALRKLAG
jgi:subtilase family serine protease